MFVGYPISSVHILTGFLLIGYLEMHYRFRFFPFSRYFKREPEILFDAPHRLNPGRKLPVTLLIKDAHKYPITLYEVEIRLKDSKGKKAKHKKTFNRQINSSWSGGIIDLDVSGLEGRLDIRGIARYKRRWRKRKVLNHNVRTSRRFPLFTELATDPLPASDLVWWGDLHYHSSYTEDFVEFGAPLPATKSTAQAQGLDFVGITDHSYDLDDKPGSWTKTDPDLVRWKKSRQEITSLNSTGGTVLIPGEEVTARNSVNRNVHLLVLNNPEFIPGSGDGAERWFRTRSEHSLEEVLDLMDDTAIAIAAHPAVPTPKLEWLLIKRGKWSIADLDQFAGWQVINGYIDKDVEKCIADWIKNLKAGKKKYIFAGNDAHGNFNCFHQIKLPMFSTHFDQEQILGKWRTGIIKNGNLHLDNILSGLRLGQSLVSDGPAVILTIPKHKNKSYGGVIPTKKLEMKIACRSSEEFGALREFLIYQGIYGQEEEKLTLHQLWSEQIFHSNSLLRLDLVDQPGYLRAHLLTDKGHQCLTNPIWIQDT